MFFTQFAMAAPQAQEAVWSFEMQNSWSQPRLVLLTGFGPFGSVKDNPSGRIVAPLYQEIQNQCAEQGTEVNKKILPVEPGIIKRFNPEKYETIINIGVAPGSGSIRLERFARNRYEDPDTGLSTSIDVLKPMDSWIEGAPLPPHITKTVAGFSIQEGDLYSAGTYVCNDTFYRVNSQKRIGYFIHIPNISREQDLRLARALGSIVCRIFEFNH